MKTLRGLALALLALTSLGHVQAEIRVRGFLYGWRRFALHPVAAVRVSTDIGFMVRTTYALARRMHLSCLPRSLALCALLRKRGYPAEVRIGVRREAGRLLAHAWVELDDVVLGETLHPDWQILPMEQAAAVLEKVAAPTS